MLFKYTAALFSAVVGVASAGECLIPNVDHCVTNEKTYKVGEVVGEEKVCLPQGEGDYTWYFRPIGSDKTIYCILDNACKVVGGGSNPDCNGKQTWKANFLPLVMTIDSTSGGLYDTAGFTFWYGNGKFSDGNNHCGCTGKGSTNIDCKCGFPINGKI